MYVWYDFYISYWPGTKPLSFLSSIFCEVRSGTYLPRAGVCPGIYQTKKNAENPRQASLTSSLLGKQVHCLHCVHKLKLRNGNYL